MSAKNLTPQQTTTLTALVQGIIPADARDEGAAAVNAGPILAGRIRSGIHTTLYLDGLKTTEEAAREQFRKRVAELTSVEIQSLLASVREQIPGFVKQLRMDVSALYLSDAGVWQRIGFPGPSFERGGYPDFDREP